MLRDFDRWTWRSAVSSAGLASLIVGIVVMSRPLVAEEPPVLMVGAPQPAAVVPGQEVTVDVGIDVGVSDDGSPRVLVGYQLAMRFDTSKLELVDVTTCLSSPPQYTTVYSTPPELTLVNGGWVGMVATNGLSGAGPTGSPCLVTIRLRSRNQTVGWTGLSFQRGQNDQGHVLSQKAALSDLGGAFHRSFDLADGAAAVVFAQPSALPGDLTGDRLVDVFDLVTHAAHLVGNAPAGRRPFLGSASSADLDGNGVVDVLDVVRLAGKVAGNTN